MRSEKSILVLILVTLLPLTTVASASFVGPVNTGFVLGHQTRALGTWTENFTTTTYADSGSITAAGWGDGVVTSPRIGGITLLDHVATTNYVRSVDVQGRKAYFCTYTEPFYPNSLHIFDLSNPSNMVNLTARHWPEFPFDLVVDGDMMFVGSDMDGDGDGDLFSYNVSDTTIVPIPFLNGVWDIVGVPVGLAMQGHFLYVAAYGSPGRFQIYDVSNPSNPILANDWAWTNVLDFVVQGQLAYAAHSTYGLKIVNVSAPYDVPQTFMGSLNTPGNATSLVVDGGLAYIADGPSGVHIVDVSNPSSPSILGTYDTAGNAHKLALQGDTLYVADGSGGLVVLDVANPTNPCLVDSYALTYAWDLDLYGGVVVVGADDGLYTFQIGSFDNLSYRGKYTNFDAYDVRVRGDVAYVAAGTDGFVTLDVSDPANPVLLDNYSTGILGYCRKLDVQGHLAFVGDYALPGHFFVFDVSDPSDIQLVSDELCGHLNDLFAWGELVFFTYSTGWGYYNISNPFSPAYTQWTTGINVTACWVQGYHLYIVIDYGGAMNLGLRIYDIQDPSNPVEVGAANYQSWNYDVFVDGDLAYNADGFWTITFNVSDPTSPFIPPNGYIYHAVHKSMGVWGFGQYVVDARYTQGVNLMDNTNVSDPTYIRNYSDATNAIQVTIHGDYVYVANRSSLVILRLYRSAASTYSTGTFTAQSVNLQPSTFYYVDATLTVDDFVPPGTSVNYYLSADGGFHWEPITCGVAHTFTYIGLDIRWKANFTSPYNDRSVHIY